MLSHLNLTQKNNHHHQLDRRLMLLQQSCCQGINLYQRSNLLSGKQIRRNG